MTSTLLKLVENHASSPNCPLWDLPFAISLGKPQTTDTKYGCFFLETLNSAAFDKFESPFLKARDKTLPVQNIECIVHLQLCTCLDVGDFFTKK